MDRSSKAAPLLVALLLAAATAAVTPAALAHGPALDPPDKVTRTVRYGDLDLSTEAGRKVLHRRVKDTAVRMCLKLAPLPAATLSQHAACQREVMRAALAKIEGAADVREVRSAGLPRSLVEVVATR